MSKYDTFWYKAMSRFFIFIGNIKWTSLKAKITGGTGYDLTEEDRTQIKNVLKENKCVILIRRKTHFTTYCIGFLSYILTGEKSYWTHVTFNAESEGQPLLFLEETGIGSHESDFNQIFDCDGACLMLAEKATPDEWFKIIAITLTMLNIPYDDLFDLTDATHMSCVEYLLQAAKQAGLEEKVFPELLSMIKKEGNLTPDMYYKCSDFKILFEKRY